MTITGRALPGYLLRTVSLASGSLAMSNSSNRHPFFSNKNLAACWSFLTLRDIAVEVVYTETDGRAISNRCFVSADAKTKNGSSPNSTIQSNASNQTRWIFFLIFSLFRRKTEGFKWLRSLHHHVVLPVIW